jgi:hypothetical protein
MNQKTKNIITKIVLIIPSLLGYLVIMSGILFINTAIAAPTDIGAALGAIETTTKLPGYQAAGHAQSSYESGASGITSAFLFVGDLLIYGMGPIAIIMIIISGLKLITAGKKIDEVATKTKESLKYEIIGLIVIMMSGTMIKTVFFGESGEVVKSAADSQLAAERGTEIIKGLYNFIEVFVGVLAVLMLVIAGFRMVTAYTKSEEQITKARKQIMWAIAGLIVIGLSELIVKDIVFPKEGSVLPNIAGAGSTIVTMTNFISGFMAVISIAMIMYGGYIYVLALGDQTKIQKGKKIVMGAVIGLVIAIGAYAIVNTVITLQPPAPTPNVGQTQQQSK